MESSQHPTAPTVSEIFEKQIIDTFGVEETSKVFTNIKNIEFIDIQLLGDQAEAVSIIEYNSGEFKTFKCFFVKQENKWYLYKTIST